MSNGCDECVYEKISQNKPPCNICVPNADHPFFALLKESTDSVNHPSHYNQGSVECIEAIKSATAGLKGIEAFCAGNAIKYLWRWKNKGGSQDVEKAIWYLERLKKELKEENGKEDV